MTIPISPEEGRALLLTVEALQHEPPPSNPRAYGCLFILLALGLVVGFPPLATALGWARVAVVAVFVVAAVLALVGAFVALFGVGFVADVDKAVTELREHYPIGSPEVIRRAAVRILLGAYHSSGPTTVHTFDFKEVARQLGPALPYVLAVERFLLEQKNISMYPVFTLDQ